MYSFCRKTTVHSPQRTRGHCLYTPHMRDCQDLYVSECAICGFYQKQMGKRGVPSFSSHGCAQVPWDTLSNYTKVVVSTCNLEPTPHRDGRISIYSKWAFDSINTRRKRLLGPLTLVAPKLIKFCPSWLLHFEQSLNKRIPSKEA